MKKILIVTDLLFPHGSAMASRIVSFCHLFNDLGYKVHVITGRTEDINDEGDCYTYSFAKSNRSYGLQSYFGNEILAKAVDDYLSKNDVEFVFTTSLNMNFKKVFDTVKNHNKKIIIEQCEWYDSSSFKFGKLDIRYINFLINIKYRYLKVDGVISISRLLDEYYKKNKVNSIRIPSILDIKNIDYRENDSNKKIKLVYTGNASKSKELVMPILEALNNEKYKKEFVFDIYGMDRNALNNIVGQRKSLIGENIHALGYFRQELIADIIKDADFQIFIRPNRKSSNAGFPTKLCESMSVGTPVICNDTGDICLYLKDGINGFVVKGTTSRAIQEVFDRILLKKNDSTMRNQARFTSEKSFDYRLYLNDVKGLIDKSWDK